MSEREPVSVLATLLVFRLFYLIIPLIAAVGIVVTFERSQFNRRRAS